METKRMRNTVYSILLALLVWMLPGVAHAQMDPVLTGMIIEYTNKAKSQYNTQLETMAMETEGHVWLNQEVKETKNFQKQFDEYLSSFRNIISYAAQTYGFYYEVNHLCENMGRLSAQIGDAPANAIAVALHNKRNDIYVSIINKSLGIINTIRQVCIDKKMTEKQRIELVFSIRPQLKDMNRQLATLTKLVKSTSMGLVWYTIEYGALPHREGKAGVVEDCLNIWRINAKNVKPKR